MLPVVSLWYKLEMATSQEMLSILFRHLSLQFGQLSIIPSNLHHVHCIVAPTTSHGLHGQCVQNGVLPLRGELSEFCSYVP